MRALKSELLPVLGLPMTATIVVGVETGAIGLADNTHWIAVRYGSTDALLEATVENGLYVQSHTLPTQMKRGQWVRVLLDVDLGRNVFGLVVDGATVVQDEPFKYPPGAPGAAQTSNIFVGTLIDNIAGPSQCQARYDDVTFDIKR